MNNLKSYEEFESLQVKTFEEMGSGDLPAGCGTCGKKKKKKSKKQKSMKWSSDLMAEHCGTCGVPPKKKKKKKGGKHLIKDSEGNYHIN